MVLNAYAGKKRNEGTVRRGTRVTFTGFVLLTVALTFCSRVTFSASRSDLNIQIEQLKDAVNKELIQSVEVLNALSVLSAPTQSITAGIVSGATGATVNYPIYFKEGVPRVASLQFDVQLPTGLTPQSVEPGIAAQAAQKGTVGNMVNGAYRVVVFGVNQNAIPSGPIAAIKVNIASNATLGKKPIQITNVVGSDAAGMNVPLTGKNGSLEVK